MRSRRTALLFGFGLLAAALIGVLAAIFLVPKADHHETVFELVSSPVQEQRLQGWALMDEISWSEDQQAALEEVVLNAGPEATLEAASHPGFEPTNHASRFAQALAPSDPRRALGWMLDSGAAPLQDWLATAEELLSSQDADIRHQALETLIENTLDRSELAELIEHIHPEGDRQRAVLNFAVGLEEATPRELLAEAGVAFETEEDAQQIRAAARKILLRKRSDIELRRFAAWRIPSLDDGATAGLLAPAPADRDGAVFATALIAQRHLSAKAAKELLKRWLLEFEADRRRSAAILSALRGEDPAALKDAFARETDPSARRTMSLALLALGAWPYPEIDPSEYTARTMRLPDGRLDPDTALLRMLAGDPAALAALSTRPELPTQELTEEDRQRWRRVIQWRAWALARMVPAWHIALGEEMAGNGAGLFSRLDMIEALRLTRDQQLLWDEASRSWRPVARTAPEEDDVSP